MNIQNQEANNKIDFNPPKTDGLKSSITYAIIIHIILIIALAAGLKWKTEEKPKSPAAMQAALWEKSEITPQKTEIKPQTKTQLKPEAIQQPKPEIKPPAPVIKPKIEAVKKPEPETKPIPKPDIVLAKKEQEQKEKLKQEKIKQEKLAKEKAQKEKVAKEAKARQEKEEQKARELKEAKAKQEREAKEKKAREAKAAEKKAAEKRRQEAIKRAAQLAAQSEFTNEGSASANTAPSPNYGAKIDAAVRPNIIFTDEIIGNPKTIIEIALDKKGKIISQKIIKSSQNKNWDAAVMRALQKTQTLPDDKGKYHTPIQIEFSPY